jgi:hypothetical protein
MSYKSAYLSPPPRRPDRKISRVTHLACLDRARQIRCGTLYPARSEKVNQGKTIGRAEYLRDSCPVLCVGYILTRRRGANRTRHTHKWDGLPTAYPRGTYFTQVHTHTHTHTSPTGKGAHAPGQGRAKALTPQPRAIAEIAAVVRVHVRDGGWREACPPNKSLSHFRQNSVRRYGVVLVYSE